MERNKSGTINIYKDFTKEAVKNFLMGIPAVRQKRLQRARTVNVYSSTDEFLKLYAFASLNLLHKYVGDLKGKTVCEIGAGDYLTSGLSILAAGASKYSVIDRFPGDYFGAEAKKWYRAIEEKWSQFYPEIPWSKNLHSENFPENYQDRLELIAEPIETAETGQKFDVVCSFQVGEHVSDIEAYAQIHRRILKDGGTALHRVDFGPHDCWFYYRDPLTFLRFSDLFWDLTRTNRGTPNRRRHHEFMKAFENAGMNTELVHTEFFDEKSIDFSSLHKRFKEMPRDSMLTATVIYRLTKK
jgi:SAM-dependent methyltransferase